MLCSVDLTLARPHLSFSALLPLSSCTSGFRGAEGVREGHAVSTFAAAFAGSLGLELRAQFVLSQEGLVPGAEEGWASGHGLLWMRHLGRLWALFPRVSTVPGPPEHPARCGATRNVVCPAGGVGMSCTCTKKIIVASLKFAPMWVSCILFAKSGPLILWKAQPHPTKFPGGGGPPTGESSTNASGSVVGVQLGSASHSGSSLSRLLP